MSRSENFIKIFEVETFKIAVKNVSDERIVIMLDDASIAELDADSDDFWKRALEEDFDIKIEGLLFWFNRLKAGRRGEGTGYGSFLMRELVKVLDQRGITVLNHVNPYGSLNMSQLKSFYKKFGFVDIGRGGMLRYPKQHRSEQNHE
jgi:GNAT superfamily N-acetyltransferase